MQLREKALDFGFDLVGIASPRDPLLQSAAQRYSNWLNQNHQASMDYLKRHQEIKQDPELFLDEVKSIVCVGLAYEGESGQSARRERHHVSAYLKGQDYHLLLKQMLEGFIINLKEENPHLKYRIFVDQEPVFERFWAWRSGLGWIGKNSLVINRKKGSYFFIGGFFTSLDLPPDNGYPDHCGRCQRCIEACPTDAILLTREIDSNRCIGYHTIENKSVIPTDIANKMQGWIAGCDICQQTCPWNDPPSTSHSFQFQNPLYTASYAELIEWDEATFKLKMKDTASARMKYGAFLRNLVLFLPYSESAQGIKIQQFRRLQERVSTLRESASKAGAIAALQFIQGKIIAG